MPSRHHFSVSIHTYLNKWRRWSMKLKILQWGN